MSGMMSIGERLGAYRFTTLPCPSTRNWKLLYFSYVNLMMKEALHSRTQTKTSRANLGKVPFDWVGRNCFCRSEEAPHSIRLWSVDLDELRHVKPLANADASENIIIDRVLCNRPPKKNLLWQSKMGPQFLSDFLICAGFLVHKLIARECNDRHSLCENFYQPRFTRSRKKMTEVENFESFFSPYDEK